MFISLQHLGVSEEQSLFVGGEEISGRMAKLADAIALGAIGVTLGGSNPLPPIKILLRKIFTPDVSNKFIKPFDIGLVRWASKLSN